MSESPSHPSIQPIYPQFPGIRLSLLSEGIAEAMEELRQLIKVQSSVGWKGEEVPTHTLRSFSLGPLSGLIDLGYVLLARNQEDQVVGFARVGFAGGAGKHYLHELAVLRESQFQGLGNVLMQEVVRYSGECEGKELWFTFGALKPANAYFYLEKCHAEVRRILPNFYGKPMDGNSYVALAVIHLGKQPFSPKPEIDLIPVVAEIPQFTQQPIFKVPVLPQTTDFLYYNHPLATLIDGLLLDLLAKDKYAISGFQRSRQPFWIIEDRKT